jgi:phenylalanyl-tRNA synthetase alpha chain
VQIRTMLKYKPPVRIIAPGVVYRHDDDPTHSPVFRQIECLHVDQGITLAHLKGTLLHFVRQLFGQQTSIRLRPSFFPFTEPSAEVDVSCVFCGGDGCRLCSDTGWIEILGSGMVDPNVYQACGYDPGAVTGYAFGLGVERVAMLLLRVPDIRLFYENDVRFLEQF